MGISAGAGAAIAGGASLIGGGISALGATSAASTQASASEQAAALQYSMYQQTAARLQPWTDTGTAATNQLGGLLGLSGYSASGAGGLSTGALTTEFQPTMAQLSATPGYQFTLNQGEAATSNAAAAMGQGGGITPKGVASPSGPEGEGLSQYAENLASTTYQQQFNNYWTQLGNIYNMLSGVSSQGANAAAGTGQAGTTAAANAGSALQSAGAASAAGTVGATNALTNSLSSLGNIATTTAALQTQNNQNQIGGAINQQTALTQPGVNIVGAGT